MGYIVLFALCFGLAICIAAYDDVTLQNGTLPDFASLCPYNTMCSSMATKSIKDSDMTSCCQKCSCANDCHMVGNCCPDIQASPLTGPLYPCADARKILNEERGLNFEQNYNLWIRVIDTCPDKQSENAFPACERPIELQDFVMVSDSDGAKVFKNQHCARCHGVEKYIVWDTHVACSEIMSKSFETFIDRDQYILNNCALMSLPADITLLEKSRCYPNYDIINRCSSTNRRNTYERELEHACETTRATQNTLFFEYFESRNLIDVYANAYCYYCNKPKGFLGDDMCPVPDLLPRKTSPFVSFSSLININAVERKDENTRCRPMTIWDPFESICRSLFCPAGSIPVHGVCIDSSTFVLGHSMALLFEVHGFDQPSYTLLQFLAGELFQYQGQNFRCGKCSPKMFSSKNSSEVFLEISVYTTRMCSRKYVLEFLGNLANQSPIQMQFIETDRFVDIFLTTTFDQPKYRRQSIAVVDKICINAITIINPVMLQNCPRIELSTQEVKALHVNHVQPEDGFENKLITNTQTNNISICIDAYFQMRNLGKSAGNELQFNKAGMKMCMLLLLWGSVF